MGISTESYPADVLKAQKTKAFGGTLPLAHPRSGMKLIRGEGGPSGLIRTGKPSLLSKSMEQFGALGSISEKYPQVL
jgi:hypothetical protein